MFTGLIEEKGRITAIEKTAGGGTRLWIEARRVLEGTQAGDSIAVNGCCLTVVALAPGRWAADTVPETLARTVIGDWREGRAVNLERSLRFDQRLGGHLVQGHVDATGIVRERRPQPDGSERVWFDAPAAVLRYVVHKGSITVDGASLTVAALDEDGFAVALIPHTLSVTTLGSRAPGARVNLEVDVVAKYVERLLGDASPRTGAPQ
jgi:riboflavin synthase